MKSTITAGIAAAVLLAAPAAVSAQEVEPNETEGLEVVDLGAPVASDATFVTIFGTGITLSVSVDETGHLTEVLLTDGGDGLVDEPAAPADAVDGAPDGAVATKVSPHKVKFELSDGEVKIDVKSNKNKVKTKIKASSLEALVGPHTWSGDLFGPDAGKTEIAFEITGEAGVPGILEPTVTGVGGESAVISMSEEMSDDEKEVKVRIELTDDEGNEARIDIKVEVEDEDDGVEAKLKITARSDLFGMEKADGHVDDPKVNVPVDDDHKKKDKKHDEDRHEKKDKKDKKHDDDDDDHDDDDVADGDDHEDEEKNEQHDDDDD